MKIIIKATNLELTPTLKEFIEEQINSLERFSKMFEDERYYNHFFGKGKPTVEAWAEVARITRHHKKGNVFRAEVQIRFPKKSIRAEAISSNIRQAIKEVKDELGRQLKKYKERIPQSLTRRRQRVLKKELKLTPGARFYRKGRIREEGI